MAFNIHYRPLCTVSMRHGFHLNKGSTEFAELDESDQKRKLDGFDIFEDLRLYVPEDTRQTLSSLGMLLKRTATGFIVGTEVNESVAGTFEPRRIPVGPFCLRFALQARAPHFWDYTNLDLRRKDGTVHYFSNRAGELDGSFPYLSAPPQTYSAGTGYHAGDIVRPTAESNDRFLAVRTGTHDAPASPDQNWIKIGAHNYVNTTDRLPLQPSVFTINSPLDTATSASIHLISADGTQRQLGSPQAQPGKTIIEFTIDARRSRIPSGHYLLRIEGVDENADPFSHSERIYIDPELVAIGAFAIVEIYHEPGESLGPFRLYDELLDEETVTFRLREPEFLVSWLNRHTFWRYHFPKPPDPGMDLGDLEMVDGQFVTKRAMPLTRGVERVDFGDETLLPNPGPGGIAPDPDRDYSDIYIHINP